MGSKAQGMKSAPGTKGWDVDFGHGVKGENMLLGFVNGKVEVKRDRVAWRSERVAVEFRYKGNPSGIAATEADWWAFVLDDMDGNVASVVMVPVPRLKQLAREAYKAGAVLSGGDGKQSDMVMIPLTSLF